MRRLRNDRGLTLTELIVVTGILGTLFLVVQQVFRQQAHSFRSSLETGVTQGEVRTWLARMTRDLRRAGYDPTESDAFGIVAFSANEVRMTFDADADGTLDAGPPEEVGYRFDPGTGVVSQWRGGTTWRPILEDVVSMQLDYFDRAGNPAGTDPDNVHVVDVTIAISPPEARRPGEPAPIVRRKVRVEVRNVALS